MLNVTNPFIAIDILQQWRPQNIVPSDLHSHNNIKIRIVIYRLHFKFKLSTLIGQSPLVEFEFFQNPNVLGHL